MQVALLMAKFEAVNDFIQGKLIIKELDCFVQSDWWLLNIKFVFNILSYY